MIVYKLMKLKKDGKLYPLFITKNVETKIGVWLEAEFNPTTGFAPRKGWHCCQYPIAPHLKEQLASGECRVWVQCEAEGIRTKKRPMSQGGLWVLADRIKVVKMLTLGELQEIRESVNNINIKEVV